MSCGIKNNAKPVRRCACHSDNTLKFSVTSFEAKEVLACQYSGFSAYASVSIDETASKIVRKSLRKIRIS